MQKKFIKVNGIQMAYVEMGSGRPIVFQHGNPTSSYLWRKVMPSLQTYGRCLALDLVGMGDSDKLGNSGPMSYSFRDHAQYFDAAMEELGVFENAVFVLHDWGSALGFHWCSRHPDTVSGICFMEAIVRPLTWDEWPQSSRQIFEGFRSDAGEAMILQKNLFVERVLPGSLINPISSHDMEEYRRPYKAVGEARRPTLSWPRMIPIAGEPRDMCEVVDRYSKWMSTTHTPKLFINGEPGAILKGAQREYCRSWPNQREISVRAGHFIPEDAPTEVASAIASWLDSLEGSRREKSG